MTAGNHGPPPRMPLADAERAARAIAETGGGPIPAEALRMIVVTLLYELDTTREQSLGWAVTHMQERWGIDVDPAESSVPWVRDLAASEPV